MKRPRNSWKWSGAAARPRNPQTRTPRGSTPEALDRLDRLRGGAHVLGLGLLLAEPRTVRKVLPVREVSLHRVEVIVPEALLLPPADHPRVFLAGAGRHRPVEKTLQRMAIRRPGDQGTRHRQKRPQRPSRHDSTSRSFHSPPVSPCSFSLDVDSSLSLAIPVAWLTSAMT